MSDNHFLKPDIILIRPQMPENIGACARAMANFSLDNLRLVSPRENHLCDKSYAMSSGATDILDNAQLFDTVSDALSPYNFVLATTARNRDIQKPVLDLEQSIALLITKIMTGHKCAIIFGPERTGLENSDITLADSLVTIPVNPDFASINLAQSVLLIAYEYFRQFGQHHIPKSPLSKPDMATKEEMDYLLNHIISSLDDTGFFYPPEKRNSSVTLINNIFSRNPLTAQEVRALRGVIKSLHPGRQHKK